MSASLPRYAAHPRTAGASARGHAYFNTTDSRVYVCDGTTWVGMNWPRGTVGPNSSAAVDVGGALQRLILTIDTSLVTPVTLADGPHGAGRLLYTFQAGSTWVLGTTLRLTLTNTANFNASPNDVWFFGIGTAQAGDDGALSGAECSLAGALSPTNSPLTVDTDSGATLSRAANVSRARCDSWCATFAGGAGTTGQVWANFAVADASNSGSNTFRATGTVELIYVTMGDS